MYHTYTVEFSGLDLVYRIKGEDHAKRLAEIAKDEPMWLKAQYLGELPWSETESRDCFVVGAPKLENLIGQ